MRMDFMIEASAGKAKPTPELQRLMDLERKTNDANREKQSPPQTDIILDRMQELLSPPSELQRVTELERATYGFNGTN